MNASYDIVIVGAGHNGLVCGAYLARAGLRVCVVERRNLIGGAAVTEELWPGYRVSTASYVMGLLQPKVTLELELQRYGLEVLTPPPLVQLQPDGRNIVFWGEEERLARELGQFSNADAAAYGAYRAHLRKLAPAVRDLMWSVPVDPTGRRPRDIRALLSFAWRNRGAMRHFYELFDLFTMSAYDYLGRWFESDAAKVAIGFYAAGGGGGNAGFRTPGTAFALTRSLLRDASTPAGGPGFVKGGMGAISGAIAASGAAHGMQVRVDAPVERIRVENGKATGVELAGGEFIACRAVVSNANARTTFLRLLNGAVLPEGFRDHVAKAQAKSTSFKVHLALSRLPRFTGFDATRAGFDYPAQLRIAPGVDYMDDSYGLAQAGRLTDRPYLTVMTPSVVDPTLAPAGHHVMSIFGGHVPNAPEEGWDALRDTLYERAIDTLSAYAPDLRDCIIHQQTLTPLDYERVFDLPGGHLQHGEMSLNQMFFNRPAPHFADHRTPVQGLYLCGAAAHPGGGVTGIPGHNAAGVIRADLRR